MYLISNQAMLFSMGLMTTVFYIFNLLLLELKLNTKRIIYLLFTALSTFSLEFFADVAQVFIPSDIIADLCALIFIYMMLADQLKKADKLYLKIFIFVFLFIYDLEL